MKKIKDIIQASVDVKQQVLQNEGLIAEIEKIVAVITDAFKKGKRV